ncbi:hypothetical protein FQN51_000425 [Onygenales sp. PD_10]|nr:hypothetical protein FQN51_000425 [Onygenales sp. PD_10]
MASTKEPTASSSTDPIASSSHPAIVEIDPDHANGEDTDSTIGSEAQSTTSASLASSILNYEYSNGRRYHAYNRGSYLLPNDEQEQDRLDLLHHCMMLGLEGRLFLAPVDNPQRILDVGTGTGIWAMSVGDEIPSAHVIGTDLSPIQPSWVPPNVQFYVEDVENEWVYGTNDAFDLIHARGMGGSIGDWDKFVRQAHTHLKPGGWIELQEPQSEAESDDESKNRVPFVNKFQTNCIEAAHKFGKSINQAPTHKQRLVDAGYINIREEIKRFPIGAWPKDPHLKELGRFWMENIVSGVEVYTLGFIGKVLDWDEAECRVLIAKATAELRDRKNHLYSDMYVVYGQKPL